METAQVCCICKEDANSLAMRNIRIHIASLVALVTVSFAAPSRRAGPTVTLDQGIFNGANDVLTGTNKFLGIPFAQPPYVL